MENFPCHKLKKGGFFGLYPKEFNDAIQLKFGLLCQQYF